MFRPGMYSIVFASMAQTAVFAQELATLPASPEAIFNEANQPQVVQPLMSVEDEELLQTSAMVPCAPPIACDGVNCDGIGCDTCAPIAGGCDSVYCEEAGWCESVLGDSLALDCLKNQELGPFTVSIGGALRYRYLDESNRLRPPLTGRDSDYSQWRFTPFLELKYDDLLTAYVQAIDAPTFGNELPLLPIDENRTDLLQYYVDAKVLEDRKGGQLRFKAGRQFLQYGSQHLISPLAWANTFRNFEGFKMYYNSADWAIDGFATRPVNGASGNIFRPVSYDTPDQSRWFSGVYATYKSAPKGVLDMYWLWLEEDEDRPNFLDGTRHTIGARYAGAHPFKDECGDPMMTLSWDYEGAVQVGEDLVAAGVREDVSAGFLSTNTGLTFNQMPWTPTVSGIFYWGSGDDDPNDGTNHTFTTLFPLGHAYWGLIDNFSGQNLIDYAAQITVKPTKKLTCLAAFHFFEKDARQDAIYNIAGVPFGGIVETERNIGTELDLVATYNVNSSLTLQAGYFWFFYDDAVSNHPNALVANRDDAEQFYFLANWTF